MRDQLLRNDEADALVPGPSWYEKSKNQKKGNAVLTEALLDDDDTSGRSGGGAVARETAGTPQWWDGTGQEG